MNLQKLNVQEMQVEELMETSGGGLWGTYWDVMTDIDNHKWALKIVGLPHDWVDSL